MKVSIVIPMYNAENFIQQTIESVINQTFINWELILVDDGSTDKTNLKIQPYLKDLRIKYIYQENSGVSSARNKGYQFASGEYLAFLDADDVWLSDNLACKVNALILDPSIGFVYSYSKNIDQHANKFGQIHKPIHGDVLDYLLAWKGSFTSPSGILISKIKIEEIGLFDPALSTSADRDFFIRIAAKYKTYCVPKVTWLYRYHDQNMHYNVTAFEHDELLILKKAHKNGLYRNTAFKRYCKIKLHALITFFWLKNSNNKFKGVQLLMKNLIKAPIFFLFMITSLIITRSYIKFTKSHIW